MKTRICILFFLAFSVNAIGQRLMNFEIGYNMHFMKPDGPNFVVDRYNETRTFLTDDLDQFGYFDGFTLGWGISGGPGTPYFEVGLNGRAQKRHAEGTVSGIDYRRDLKIRNHTIYLGLGLVTGDGAILIPGVRGEFGNLKARTRIGTIDDYKSEDWEEVHDSFAFYLTGFVKIAVGLFVIEPYYSFDLLSGNSVDGFESVNQAINPNTYQNDPDPLPFDGGGFGIRLVFGTAGLFGG